jgi:hypothetical protein
MDEYRHKQYMEKVERIIMNSVQSEIVELDNRLRFEDGRLYITRTPYKDGIQSEFSKKIDVTEDVLDMFLEILECRKSNL